MMSHKLPVLCKKINEKCPLYNTIDPRMKNFEVVNYICSLPLENMCLVYAMALGVLGMAFSLVDIVKIMKSGSVLSCPLYKNRLKECKIVKPEYERDLKLVTLVLSSEYYLLLVIGTLMRYPALFLPWLILHAFVIVGEFTLFIAQLCMEGCAITKKSLFLSMLLIHNWLCIFCVFFHMSKNLH